MTDLRAEFATVAEGLDEVAVGLRDLAQVVNSPPEREGFIEAAADAIRLSRKLRNLIFFTRVGTGRAPVGARAPEGSRPSAQLALVDETDDDQPTTS